MRTIPSTRSLLFALVMLSMPAASFAQSGVFITIAPPALPVYEQPLCPAEGYIWTPGYWAYGDDFDDYYWVPGTWVLAPGDKCALQFRLPEAADDSHPRHRCNYRRVICPQLD